MIDEQLSNYLDSAQLLSQATWIRFYLKTVKQDRDHDPYAY